MAAKKRPASAVAWDFTAQGTPDIIVTRLKAALDQARAAADFTAADLLAGGVLELVTAVARSAALSATLVVEGQILYEPTTGIAQLTACNFSLVPRPQR